MLNSETPALRPYAHLNRGYFSEDIIVGYRRLDVVPDGPSSPFDRRIAATGSLATRMFNTRFAPILSTIGEPTPRRPPRLLPPMRWKQYRTRVPVTFPIQTIQPIVQVLAHQAIGKLPRDVEVERRMRRFAKLSLADQVAEAGVPTWQLIPVHVLRRSGDLEPAETDSFDAPYSRLPLEWFDDFDLDSLTPLDWLRMGQLPGERHPLPADAFLPRQFFSEITEATVDQQVRMSWRQSLQGTSMLLPGASASSVVPGAQRRSVTSKTYTEAEAEALRKQLMRAHQFVWTRVSVHQYNSQTMRWLVMDLEANRYYTIPRIYLRFLAEDGKLFVDRVLKAMERRRMADKQLKFGLVADSMVLVGVPGPTTWQMERMFALTAWRQRGGAERQITNEEAAALDRERERWWRAQHELAEQMVLDYQRTQSYVELRDTVLRLNAEQFEFLEFPERDSGAGGDSQCLIRRPRMQIAERLASLASAHEWLRVNTLFCRVEVIQAMEAVHEKCTMVANRRFFSAQYLKTATLDDFSAMQEQCITRELLFVQVDWLRQAAAVININVRKVGKGWFDLRLANRHDYECSKTIRLLALVQFRMQQALREMVEGSVRQWMRMLCKPCECVLEVEEDFEWDPQNVIDSPFMPPTKVPHVFYLVLEMNVEQGPYYSVEVDKYEPELVRLFVKPLREAHRVRLIEPQVMTELCFAPDLFLTSVGMLEDVIDENLTLLQRSYKQVTIPLLAYLKQYERHSDFYALNKAVYLKEFKDADKSSQAYQDEITMHFRLKENLERTLPSSIQIASFLINTETLKEHLVHKRQEIAMKLIEMLIGKLRDETQMIVDEYGDILKKLCEKPQSIEMLFATRDWMETLPEIITEFDSTMRLKLFEYDILDAFWIALPNEEFRIKWAALAGPYRCNKQIIATREMFDEDVERFFKAQVGDVATYEERFESLNMAATTIMLQYEPEKCTETSIEIRKLSKIVAEVMEYGQLLNKRQMLFEEPELNMEPMNDLDNSFKPYRNLWLTAAEFLKWEEAWRGNPLPNVEVEKVRAAMAEYMSIIDDCVRVFQELPRMQVIAEFYFSEMQQFMPKVDVIEWIKNPAWITVYWQEFNKQTGCEIRPSLNMSFDYCQSKGIMNFYKEVGEMSDTATRNKDALEAKMLEEEEMRRAAEQAIIDRKNARRGRKLT